MPLLPLAGLIAALQQPAPDSLVVFVGVTVLTMRSAEVLADQVVVVRKGIVTEIEPAARFRIPAGARRLDAHGKYLMPGLADFHVHAAEAGDLARYLAAGVTTIGHMGGHGGTMLALRDSIRAGRRVGPEMYLGYFVNGPSGLGGPMTVRTVGDARAAVADAAERGFDFIKVYNSLTEEQYAAIIADARTRGLPVLGHAVRSIGLERGLSIGQVAVVHAEEYTYAELRNRRDSASLAHAVEFTRRHAAALVPNLSAFDVITRQWGKPIVVDSFFAMPEATGLSEYWRGRWRSADYVTRRGALTALPFLKQLTLAMQRGGVRLLLGTDSPTIPGMFAGASIHEELRLLVEAGLTPYEALTAGTRAAGEFARQHFKARPFGIVAPGYRADLVLLERNPLENVGHARNPLGVMVRGTWIAGHHR
jgi:imidazolonepropionase-like amidohydrolase